MNRGRLAVVLLWCGVLLISYLFFIPQRLPSEYDITSHERLVDAIVLIAMGKMTEDSMIDFSISSIRKVGNWKGDIYMLTDRKGCFSDAVSSYDVKLIEMQPLSTIIQIKALKPRLMQYLPVSVTGALYLDVDILVTRDLGSFLSDLRETVTRNSALRKIKSKIAADKIRRHGGIPVPLSNSSMSVFDYGAFLDAKGHYVGFCSGCEKWHTGVVWLQRGKGEGGGGGGRNIIGAVKLSGPVISANTTKMANKVENNRDNMSVREMVAATGATTGAATGKDIGKETAGKETVKATGITRVAGIGGEWGHSCMTAWENILLSGKYTTDQESLDEAERVGACPAALTLPGKHLLFAKDYIGMAFTAGQTFLHLTAAGRIESQDFFYREIIVPRLRNSLRPTLNPHIIKVKKTC